MGWQGEMCWCPRPGGNGGCGFRKTCLDGELDDLLDWTFEGCGETNVGDNIILTTTNIISEHVNEIVATRFPGNESHHLLSSDSLDAEDVETPSPRSSTNLPQEIRASARVKVGMPLILLRNLDPSGDCVTERA